MANDPRELKKAINDALFGTSKPLTVAAFRSALSAIVDHLVAFKKEVLSKVEQAAKGADGRDGKDGRHGIDGRNGKDGKDGTNGIPGRAGKDGSPDTGEEIVDKVNKDKSGKVIKKEHVEGLDDIETMARIADANARSFMNTGSYVYAHDLSSSLDGVTKTFTLPSNARVILAFGSSAPGVFRPTTDYTTTASTITFTSEITAGSTLASGQTVIVLYKIL